MLNYFFSPLFFKKRKSVPFFIPLLQLSVFRWSPFSFLVFAILLSFLGIMLACDGTTSRGPHKANTSCEHDPFFKPPLHWNWREITCRLGHWHISGSFLIRQWNLGLQTFITRGKWMQWGCLLLGYTIPCLAHSIHNKSRCLRIHLSSWHIICNFAWLSWNYEWCL